VSSSLDGRHVPNSEETTLIRKLSRIATFGIVLTCITAPAFAEFAAIAFGDGGKAWGWARKGDQKTANSVALQACMESSKSKDCELDRTVALARAEGGNRTSWAKSSKSLADAKRSAIEACGNPDCKILFSTTSPGFFSLAKSVNEEGEGTVYHLFYEQTNSDESDKSAVDACKQRANRSCKLEWSAAIPGKIKSEPEAKVTPTPSAKSCRPTTQPLRCTSQCTNGNCVITYQNGCKVNVQVQPKFDPFSNQWTYPSPSC
jgi:hypothetical protein